MSIALTSTAIIELFFLLLYLHGLSTNPENTKKIGTLFFIYIPLILTVIISSFYIIFGLLIFYMRRKIYYNDGEKTLSSNLFDDNKFKIYYENKKNPFFLTNEYLEGNILGCPTRIGWELPLQRGSLAYINVYLFVYKKFQPTQIEKLVFSFPGRISLKGNLFADIKPDIIEKIKNIKETRMPITNFIN